MTLFYQTKIKGDLLQVMFTLIYLFQLLLRSNFGPIHTLQKLFPFGVNTKVKMEN